MHTNYSFLINFSWSYFLIFCLLSLTMRYLFSYKILFFYFLFYFSFSFYFLLCHKILSRRKNGGRHHLFVVICERSWNPGRGFIVGFNVRFWKMHANEWLVLMRMCPRFFVTFEKYEEDIQLGAHSVQKDIVQKFPLVVFFQLFSGTLALF